MSAALYRPSLALILAHEGGFTNNPHDPGGPTMQGITQKVYDAYRINKGRKLQSVKFISSIELEEIYRTNYWRLIRGDSLPAGLDYATFDFAVNSGVGRALRYLQTLVGVEPDGALGDISLAAIYKAATANEEKLIADYCAARVTFMKSLSTFAVFGKGWVRRVNGLQDGVQREDSGVLDYATIFARADTTYSMPTAIGNLEGEVNGKAVGNDVGVASLLHKLP